MKEKNEEDMKVAIYGAGAMGTVLGAYIAKAGVDIDLINRNEKHVAALKEKGAHIIGTVDFTQKVNALLPSEMSEKYDIILLMTKQRYNGEIVAFLKDYLKEDGALAHARTGARIQDRGNDRRGKDARLRHRLGRDFSRGRRVGTHFRARRFDLFPRGVRQGESFAGRQRPIGKDGRSDRGRKLYRRALVETSDQQRVFGAFHGHRARLSAIFPKRKNREKSPRGS